MVIRKSRGETAASTLMPHEVELMRASDITSVSGLARSASHLPRYSLRGGAEISKVEVVSEQTWTRQRQVGRAGRR